MEIFENETFEESKKRYLTSLKENRGELVKILENPSISSKNGLMGIVIDPRNYQELEFGISYLGFFDDKKQITESIKYDNIKRINSDESVGVEYVAGIIKSLLEGKDIKGKTDFYLNTETFTKGFFELTVLSVYDYNELMIAIARKMGYTLSTKVNPLWHIIDRDYQRLLQIMNNFILPIIDKSSPNINHALERFINIANAFHRNYLNSLMVDKKQANVTSLETQTKSKK